MKNNEFANELCLRANKAYSLEENIAFAVNYYMYNWQLTHPNADTDKYNRAFNRANKRITRELTEAASKIN